MYSTITIKYRRKYLHIFLLCLLILTIMLVLIQSHNFKKIYDYIQPIYYTELEDNRIRCYEVKVPSLPDILEDEPRGGNSIFFLETSCTSYCKGRIAINARQACAVESAAMMNPNKDIYLLYTSPGIVDLQGDESDRLLSSLMEYKNVKLRRLHFENYLRGTPVEVLSWRRSVQKSMYPESHASDLLRYLTLWKYGGIYLDLDIVAIKSFEGFAPNFAAAESDSYLNAAVISFSPSGEGHELAKKCLYDLRDNFNGTIWGHNGPGVITRVLLEVCGLESAKEVEGRTCQGFQVYHRSQFYPVQWEAWSLFFNENYTDTVFYMSRNSSILHIWNNLSKNIKIPLGSPVAYMAYAEKFCPKVIQQCEYVF